MIAEIEKSGANQLDLALAMLETEESTGFWLDVVIEFLSRIDDKYLKEAKDDLKEICLDVCDADELCDVDELCSDYCEDVYE